MERPGPRERQRTSVPTKFNNSSKSCWLFVCCANGCFFPSIAARADGRCVHVTAVGDVAFRRQVGKTVAAAGPDPFSAVSGSLASDLAFANLETVLTERKIPERATATPYPIIGSPKQGAQVLARTGFAVVSIANNHAFDFFAPGFADTLGALAQAGVVAIGGG